MPSSDYASAIGGGLKLKGSIGAGIDKKKAKKKKKATSSEIISKPPPETDDAAIPNANTKNDSNDEEGEEEVATKRSIAKDGNLVDMPIQEKATARDDGKTEAERRYEERRRKRLDKRLRREGVQTHKERVEKLNKYLSGLSEHHDMPRIGPG